MIVQNVTGKNMETIANGPIEEVIALAKSHYNIFVPNSGKLYTEMCNRIKARLDKEGLSHEICRPE